MSEDAKVTLGIVDAGTLSWTDPATGERHTTKLDLESLAVALSQFSGSADMTNPVEVERFATALRSSQQGRDLLRHQHEEGAQQKLLAEFGKFLAQRDATSESDTDVPPESARTEEGGEVVGEPAHGAPVQAWLDWYHAQKNAGYKVTLKDVAHKSGYSHGYVRQLHAACPKCVE